MMTFSQESSLKFNLMLRNDKIRRCRRRPNAAEGIPFFFSFLLAVAPTATQERGKKLYLSARETKTYHEYLGTNLKRCTAPVLSIHPVYST